MGFVFSIVYFFSNYLTPAYLFGSLASLHIEVILAALVLLVSLPALVRSFLLKIPQSLALIGLGIAVFLSVLVGSRGFDGAVQSFLLFIPSGVSFFFVCLHCNTKRRLKILILMMFFVCLFVIAHGVIDLWRGIPQNTPLPDNLSGIQVDPKVTASPYMIRQRSGDEGWIYRLQGLGEISDPNDFGQLIVCVIPLMFIFWRKKKIFNVAFVILPVCALLLGTYLTHSRGALVALTAVAIVAARRRIGLLRAALLAGLLFVAAMALQFTGGRDISASAGEDRTALWGSSLQMLKTHPLFGVGFTSLADQIGLTAHNSIAVCAAELGVFGLFFWSLFLFSTFSDAVVIASPLKVSEGETPIIEQSPYQQVTRQTEEISKAEVNRFGSVIFLSLTGFLVAGWFISRAFVMTMFMLGGMTEVVYEMALRRGMIAARLRHTKVLPYSGALTVGLVLLLYITVRILNLFH